MVEGFKNTEIGAIPYDWEVKQLLENTNLMTNGFVGVSKLHYTDYENGILYIQGYNVEENGFNLHGIKRITNEFHNQHLKSCLREGDLLTIQTGDIGVTTVVPKKLEGSNCHALIITRFKKGIADPLFYSYYFNFSEGRKRLKEIETGSTMKHINVGDMRYLLIPCPTKAEQTAIATALNDADALISQLEKLIAKKKAIKQGAMQELLKPKEGWEEKEFGEIFKKINAKSFQLQTKEYQSSGSFPIIDQGKEKIVGYTDNKNKLFNCPKKGIIVFGDHTRILKFIDFNFAIGADGTQLLDIKDNYSSKFMFYFLSLNEVPNTGYNRHFKFLVKMKYIVPVGETEQANIAQILSDLDSEIQKMEIKIEKYKMLKIGMMQCLLTGKIRLV